MLFYSLFVTVCDFAVDLLWSRMKISDISVDISPIYPILVMFDTISTIYPISAIYRRYIGFGPIYRGNIKYVAHIRVSLIFR